MSEEEQRIEIERLTIENASLSAQCRTKKRGEIFAALMVLLAIASIFVFQGEIKTNWGTVQTAPAIFILLIASATIVLFPTLLKGVKNENK
jgi:hypothetical protein